MLTPTSVTIRLFLHILGAAIWVGGELVLAGLLPTLRKLGDNVPTIVARAYNRIAWPAFALLVLTGLWNLSEYHLNLVSTDRQVSVFVHVSVAALSGMTAALHTGARSRLVLAISGSLGGLVALAALFLGILLRTA